MNKPPSGFIKVILIIDTDSFKITVQITIIHKALI